MGIIEELLLMAKEAIDDANQRGRRPAGAPAAPAPEDVDEEELETQREFAENRAAQARARLEFQQQRQAAERAEQERQREIQERERQRQQRKSEVARVVHATSAVDPARIARLVRHPQALREMIVLNEVLGKPLAMRKKTR